MIERMTDDEFEARANALTGTDTPWHALSDFMEREARRARRVEQAEKIQALADALEWLVAETQNEHVTRAAAAKVSAALRLAGKP